MVLYILVFFVVAAPVVVYLSLNYYRASVEKSVEEQQSMLVARIADELDQKMIFSQDTLITASRSINPKIISTPSKAEEFLYNNLALISIFDNGVFLFTSDGKMIAETSQKPSRIGMDFSYREYMKRTIATKRPVISPPFISSMSHHHPAVMFTVPIIDDNGKLLAVFGGSIDLMKPNFLGALSEAKIGKNGYFHLSTADHITIIHPEKDRIMAPAPTGQNKLYDKAIREFEGAGKTETDSGMHMISAFRRLKTVDWGISANYPENEALEPIRGATRFAWVMVLFGGIVTGAVFWLVTRQLIAPLISFTEQIRMIHADEDHNRKVEISTNDEIRELATVFNGLMSNLDEKEKNLKMVNEDLELRVAERTEQLEQTNRMLQVEIQNSESAQEEITCLNEDLSRRAFSLETINRELESFSYSISHDLRAPVRHIKGYINILKEDHADKFDAEVNQLFNRISASSGKLEQLISDILDLSRVTLTEIRNVSVDLSRIASEVACILRENEPGRSVEFDIEDGVTLTGDPALLQLVMQNLLENAWKYSARSASSLIRFGKIESGNETTCFVSDNGIGFDMANADLIFGVFQRLHSSADYEGSGIGLATVQRIIHRHEGRIWAEGDVDKGSTFYFSIPQA
jgi:signal transduction histidine kinase